MVELFKGIWSIFDVRLDLPWIGSWTILEMFVLTVGLYFLADFVADLMYRRKDD